jgi:para-aminobenzoate synthetase component I
MTDVPFRAQTYIPHKSGRAQLDDRWITSEQIAINTTTTRVEELSDCPPPAEALRAFADLPYPLLLESATGDPRDGRYSYLMADPFSVLRERMDDVASGQRAAAVALGADPFERLRGLLAAHRLPSLPGLPPFQGGAAGYFGYDLGRCLERLPRHRQDDLELPDIVIGLYDWTIAWDHLLGRCWLISTGRPASGVAAGRRARFRGAMVHERLRESRSVEVEQTTRAPAANPAAPLHPVPGHRGVCSNFSRDGYLEAVQRVREYILAGDIFQANLSQRLQAPISGSALSLYMRLRERSPAPYAAYLDFGDAFLVSSSPELFLRLRGSSVETQPIKGTSPRSTDPLEDASRVAALERSEKDRAENVMIVDLLRNDLSRVCKDDSVEVPRLCGIESHGPVHHLVSTVIGELRSGCDAIDLLRASFPGGSITGAPKIRAMEVIAELEPTQRGPYTGSLGFIGFDGTMETSIVIRTFVISKGVAYFQAGGGIVVDSEPAREYQETLDKAAGLIAAVTEPL